jgi:4'-phosphopantetheinyl transferase EntD
MEAAGRARSTVPIGPDGSPVWPTGFTGSVTHSSTLAMAAVAKTSDYASIGIDCEEIMTDEAASQIAAIVLSEEERAKGLAPESIGIDFASLITVVFSAKESIYKCLRPLAGNFFEFHDVHLVEIDLERGKVIAQLARDLSADLRQRTKIVGRFMIDREKVYTFTALEPSWKSAP